MVGHKDTVGFVGLGSQGAPMARRIVDAGFPLLLWARRADSLSPFNGTAAESIRSLAELGARADHVGVCVVDDVGVQEVVHALLPTMRPGSRIAIHSTVHPNTCKFLAELAARIGIGLLDAPVSGGGPAAAAGTLTVMVGGDERDASAARPVFETFGSNVIHLGNVGAGQLAKLVNNSLMAANMALADAALAAGVSLGIDRHALTDLIKASSGRSYALEVRARLENLESFSHGAKLLSKDVRLLATVLNIEAGGQLLRNTAQPFLERILQAHTPGD